MNPWCDLPTDSPYVLATDNEAIVQFNAKAPPPLRVELSLMPEPFVGRVDAPVVLLTLNPGVSDADFALHRDPKFRAIVRRCHTQNTMDYPNYYLDPAVSGPGARWLHRITRPLVSEFGARAVSTSLTLIEYFPYHSVRFGHGKLRVPSQEHTFSLVRDAIARGAIVFITRGRSLWQAAVPALRAHPRVFATRSVQNIVISPKNCPDGYPAVAAALRDGTAAC